MFLTLSDDPQPYVLEFDRPNDPHSVFYLQPQNAEQTQVYLASHQREKSRSGAAEAQAKRLADVDRRYLLTCLVWVENAMIEGDKISEPEELGKLVLRLDHYQLQELIFAAQNTARLMESAKNS